MRLLFVYMFIVTANGKSFNMGTYKAEMLSIDPCDSREPNKFDKFIINIINHKYGTQDIKYEGQIYESIGPLGLEVVSKQINEENNKENKMFINKKIPNICSSNIFTRYADFAKFLDSKCYLIPGSIHYTSHDVNKFIHMIFVKHFFYSKFNTKMVLLAAKKPVSCFDIVSRTVPA